MYINRCRISEQYACVIFFPRQTLNTKESGETIAFGSNSAALPSFVPDERLRSGKWAHALFPGNQLVTKPTLPCRLDQPTCKCRLGYLLIYLTFSNWKLLRSIILVVKTLLEFLLTSGRKCLGSPRVSDFLLLKLVQTHPFTVRSKISRGETAVLSECDLPSTPALHQNNHYK